MYVSGVYCGELWAVFYFYYVPCFSVFFGSKCQPLVHVINSNQNIVKGARWCLSTVYEFTGHRSRLQVTGQARGQRDRQGIEITVVKSSHLVAKFSIEVFAGCSAELFFLIQPPTWTINSPSLRVFVNTGYNKKFMLINAAEQFQRL